MAILSSIYVSVFICSRWTEMKIAQMKTEAH